MMTRVYSGADTVRRPVSRLLLEEADAAELSPVLPSGASGSDRSSVTVLVGVVAEDCVVRPELLDRVWLCAAADGLCSGLALPSVQQITAISVEPMSLFLMRYLGRRIYFFTSSES
jgi:hypothetical protein